MSTSEESRSEPKRRIQFAFTDEQEEFRSAVRRFLNDKSPTNEVRRLMATVEGYDPAVWRQLSEDLALPGIHIPEQYGGAGFGMVELCIVAEEFGRALLCAPYFSTAVLAANAILNAGTDAQKSVFLPDIAKGARLATLAITEPDGNWDPAGIKVVATRDADGFRLDGAKPILRTLDQAAIALANEMVGGAQTLLGSAVDYSKLRVQFGRTIGSFQAIKHRLADMLLEVELAKSAAYYAAQAAAINDPEWPALASLAKAAASEAYLHSAAECIQLHGGIGFTWDNDTHLWFKRAKSSEVFLGQPSYHRELLMQRWGV